MDECRLLLEILPPDELTIDMVKSNSIKHLVETNSEMEDKIRGIIDKLEQKSTAL